MKFLLSEENHFLRAAIKKVIHRNYPTASIEEAITGSELLAKALNKNHHWDLIISNIQSTGLAGIELTETLRKTQHIHILILSAVKLEDYANFAFLNYISGFILNNNISKDLPNAINSISSNGKYFTNQLRIAC